MVIMSLKVWFSNNNYSTALNNLNALIAPAKVQPGCISCHVYEGLENNPPIFFVEEWEDEEQLRHYMCSEDFKVILEMIELSETMPEFTLKTVTGSIGLDGLAQFRD